MHNILIYGGTFDPIHNGHINTAINVQTHFHFEQFIFLPCKIPVLKSPALATEEHRVVMLRLALQEQDKAFHFSLDLSEINRPSPSYMVHTLENFRRQLGKNFSITLLMGEDTFSQLPQWYAWQKIIEFANLLIIKRPAALVKKFSPVLEKLMQTHCSDDDKVLCHNSHGFIYCFDAGNFAISSSWIRQQLSVSKTIEKYVPETIVNYIKQNGLYKM